MCGWEGVLDLENEEYEVSFSGQGPASPSCYCLHLGMPVHREPIPPDQPGTRLSPASESLPLTWS